MHIRRSVSSVTVALLLFPVCLFGQIFTSPAKNALVLTSASIQPPQAFVDNIGKFKNYSGGQVSNVVSNLTGVVTSIDGTFLVNWADVAVNSSGAVNLDLSGKSLTQISVADILDKLAASSTQQGNPGVLNLSGGTNGAAPSFVAKIDFNPMNLTTDTDLGVCGVNGQPLLFFDSSINLADSPPILWEALNDTVITAGKQDSPTKQQIITNIVSRSGGKIVDLGGLIIRISPSDHALEPFFMNDFSGASAVLSGASANSLRKLTWTVTTN